MNEQILKEVLLRVAERLELRRAPDAKVVPMNPASCFPNVENLMKGQPVDDANPTENFSDEMRAVSFDRQPI